MRKIAQWPKKLLLSAVICVIQFILVMSKVIHRSEDRIYGLMKIVMKLVLEGEKELW
jgi:hypothetical protein